MKCESIKFKKCSSEVNDISITGNNTGDGQINIDNSTFCFGTSIVSYISFASLDEAEQVALEILDMVAELEV